MPVDLPRLPYIDGLEPDPARRPPPPGDIRLRRIVADHLRLARRCRRPACRTGRGCRTRTVPCFDEQRDVVAEAMNAFLYAGYFDPDEDDGF